MVEVLHLYLDDSGTRDLNRTPGRLAAHARDWFALGGVLIRQADELAARQHHARLMHSWGLDPDTVFLHSADIRNKTGEFTWLGGLQQAKRDRFMDDLTHLLCDPPFIGIACVIDRPGYEARYRPLFGRAQWSLCKTAFSILVERAAKYAIECNCKLRVYAERADQIVDGWMKGYYDHLREHGLPFDAANMQGYRPLTASELRDVLYDFKIKNKTSAIMQIADLYLWPMAIGGYHRSNTAYAKLRAEGKLIDCLLSPEQIASRGVKYSCWEGVDLRP